MRYLSLLLILSLFMVAFSSEEMLTRDLKKIEHFYSQQAKYHFTYQQEVTQGNQPVHQLSNEGEFLKYNDFFFSKTPGTLNLTNKTLDLVVDLKRKKMYLKQYDQAERPKSIPGADIIGGFMNKVDSSKMLLPSPNHTSYTCHFSNSLYDSIHFVLNNQGFYEEIDVHSQPGVETQMKLSFQKQPGRIHINQSQYKFSTYIKLTKDGLYHPVGQYANFELNTLKL